MISKPLKCVVIDDEKYAIENLKNHISTISSLELYKSYSDPILALSEISATDGIDLLFLDIDMPALSGIDLAKKLRNKVRFLVFVSAHSKYALEAFEVKANNYLLKPIDKIKFIEIVNDFIDLQNQVQVEHNSIRDAIFVRPGGKGKFMKLQLNDIILIHAERNYVHLNTTKESISTLDSIKNIEAFLENDDRFLRVHKSYIINKDKIVGVEGNIIQLTEGWKATIGDQYKIKFREFISKKLL